MAKREFRITGRVEAVPSEEDGLREAEEILARLVAMAFVEDHPRLFEPQRQRAIP